MVDAAAMTFGGARGLGALHRAAELAAASRTVYAVAGLTPRLSNLLTALWPAPYPELHPDRDAAVAALARRAPWPTTRMAAAAS